MARKRSEEILSRERADAWNEYLNATRNQIDFRYAEVEPWAWNRLVVRLRTIDTRIRTLAEPARGVHEEDDGA